jgi:excisionase family DNA binding protein
MPQAETSELLTVPEVAAWLKLKPKTVYEWAARGKLPCIRLGGLLRFSRADVSLWLDARKEGSCVRRKAS